MLSLPLRSGVKKSPFAVVKLKDLCLNESDSVLSGNGRSNKASMPIKWLTEVSFPD